MGICLFVGVLAQSCGRSNTFPIEPKIEFVSYSKDTVSQGDSMQIIVSFTDGDGDIGFSEVSSKTCDVCTLEGDSSCLNHPTWSLFLIDGRDSCLEFFQLPYFSSSGKNQSLEGEITIDKYNVCCKKTGFTACTPLSIGVMDSSRWYVVLKDRSGHFSNYLSLPTVQIKCYP